MDGISKGTWQRIALCKVLQERNEKNVNGRTICSVSVSQGVVNQVEYLGRSFAAKQTSHYNIVKYGDIVYTKSPTGNFPYGIIKRSNIREDVAVSPLYGVYIPASDSIGVFLHFYFNPQIAPQTGHITQISSHRTSRSSSAVANKDFNRRRAGSPSIR